jgi:hypothetical protein
MSAMKSEELRQLCARKEKRYTAFKSCHHCFRNEIDHDPGLREPRDKRDERDE